ncbi:uncharacterized protein E0L32_007243 [Thyridium curvatum]|uniref:Uncharacterized protein n=1 Tax=Thyridium curvatum TaxID=1093900 RepID=A0A507B5K0_9PEZI|nr:uncharacterized protein E0L32_007243 [Thyridium curvatum]TPX12128.1 hypothetical protein E0L32_007243 [Thyridium curvatum]
MDDATRLISELQSKLTELDGKVAAHLRDMATEFQRYSDQLLQDVPADVSNKVNRVIAESMADYPAFNPALKYLDSNTALPAAAAAAGAGAGAGAAATTTTATTDNDLASRNRRTSPPPVLPHTSGTPKEGIRGPHDREMEFYGVFTPGYLPLLDSSDRPLHSPPLSPPPVKAIEAAVKSNETSQTESSPEGGLPRPALPKRRGTDTSSISLESSGSESTKVRRSALRRSSGSSTKASPRRVRFDFEGEEVLPTSSPQASSPARPQLRTGVPQGGFEDDSDLPAGRLDDGSDRATSPPRAKKVSSSEALRALSKMPLEDPANWTVVNAQPEPENLDSTTEIVPDRDTSADRSRTPAVSGRASGKAPARSALITQIEQTRDTTLGSPLEDYEQQQEEDSSDEDFISMRSSKKDSASPGSRSPVTALATQPDISTLSQRLNGDGASPAPRTGTDTQVDTKRRAFETDDELFEFDEDEKTSSVGYPLTRTIKSTEPYIPEEESDEEHESTAANSHVENTFSTSPAVGITSRNRKPPSPPISASIGSFRGRPIMLDVVKDPRILEEAAEMGDFDTFVGSVDGRSGVDKSDLNSFRASLSNAQYSGTPRSFSERFAMEQMEQATGSRRGGDRR